MKVSQQIKMLKLASLTLASITMLGCSTEDDQPVNDTTVLSEQAVPAATGGVFTGTENKIIINISPGSLPADATLTVARLASKTAAKGEVSSVSSGYRISLLDQNGSEVSASEDIKLEFVVSSAPVHPQLGEVAEQSGSEWEGLKANFYRPSTQQVVALTSNINGTFRAQLRTLQATTGATVDAGKEVFMNETFGNEAFFGGTIGLHEVLNGVTPANAVALGVQVDLTKVPQGIVDVMIGTDLDAKDAALQNSDITKALIKAGAVIGVKGVYATEAVEDNTMISAGLTCALCHVNVTPTEFNMNAGTVALPIGVPSIDGIPNAKMNSGAILASTPFVVGAGQGTVDVLNSWEAGRFDVRALPDNVLEDNEVNPTAYPPIWNFVDLEEQGYTIGWDGLFQSSAANNNGLASISEAVYDLVMHSNGAFGTASGTLSPELSVTPPQSLLDALAAAETNATGNDITEQKLLDIQDFMRSITSPAPGVFNEVDAENGFELFYGKANCSSCHSSADLTGPGLFKVTAVDPVGGLAGGIHVPSLRGISSTAPYFHDSSAQTLTDVIDQKIAKTTVTGVPALTANEKLSLVEFLKSL